MGHSMSDILSWSDPPLRSRFYRLPFVFNDISGSFVRIQLSAFGFQLSATPISPPRLSWSTGRSASATCLSFVFIDISGSFVKKRVCLSSAQSGSGRPTNWTSAPSRWKVAEMGGGGQRGRPPGWTICPFQNIRYYSSSQYGVCQAESSRRAARVVAMCKAVSES